MEPEILIAAFKEWLSRNTYQVVNPEDPLKVVFKDKDGDNHTVMFTGIKGNHGAVATDSRFAGAMVQKFMEDALGDKGKIEKAEFKLPAGSQKEAIDVLQEAINSNRPEDLKDALKKCGAEIHDSDPSLDLITSSYDKLKEAARLSGDPKKIGEVEQLGKLVELAKAVSSLKSDDVLGDFKLTVGEREFKRFKKAGKIKGERLMKDIRVGEKFFDEDYNLCMAVGFEKGLVGGDYINTVVLESGSKEAFSGLPIKRSLEGKVQLIDL